MDDRKHRFKPGDYVCSTLIVETLGDSLFRTQNTLYEGVGEGERCRWPFTTSSGSERATARQKSKRWLLTTCNLLVFDRMRYVSL